FANQQLAGMLKSGIPLEGALKQLSSTMQQGHLRGELERLHAQLAQGIPLLQAIASCKLPDFYVRMIQIGARSNDLPAILTLLADHYQRRNSLWTRLKGLLVYPAIVLVTSLMLSIFLAISLGHFAKEIVAAFDNGGVMSVKDQINLFLFTPIILLGLLTAAFLIAISVPPIRNSLRWRFIGFREANLSHFAASLQLLLKQGATLGEALGLMRQLESGTPLAEEIDRWQKCLSSGRVKSRDLAVGSKIIPPLFFWLIAGDEEDWVTGLGRAAEIYHRRATHKIDTLLYAALPVSILVLGVMIITEIYPVISVITRVMDSGFDGQ
ncbi:MAG: epsF 1, partial [Verrucomicrobiales bacterium]|nr:epsF 1 [Verrucomicrobiales bacterium]